MSIRPALLLDGSGSTFEIFLKEEGILDEVDAVAINRVSDWLITNRASNSCAEDDSNELPVKAE